MSIPGTITETETPQNITMEEETQWSFCPPCPTCNCPNYAKENCGIFMHPSRYFHSCPECVCGIIWTTLFCCCCCCCTCKIGDVIETSKVTPAAL